MEVKYRAFTLIELVLVIVITSIIITSIASFIALPIRIYSKIVNRAELVDFAEMVVRQIEYDIRTSVPNSVRVKTSGSLKGIELLHSVGAYRYRINPIGPTSLYTGSSDAEFNILGLFSSEVLAGGPYRVVINNTGDEVNDDSDQPYPGRNIYATPVTPGVITPVTTTVTLTNPSGNEGHVVLNPAFVFREDSPRQRIYLADTPISYICNLSTGSQNITKYWSYALQPIQPIDPTTTPLSTANQALVTKQITDCNFTYQSGSSERYGVVTIVITVKDPRSAEQVRLVQQVMVPNAA